MSYPTVGHVPAQRLSPQQIALLERMRAGGMCPTDAAIPPRGAAVPLLSSAQQRIWVSEQLWPGTAVQNLTAAITFLGPLDVPALRAALARIVARHEILRTSYRTGARGVDITVAAVGAELELVRLANVGRRQAEDDARAMANTMAGELVDLSKGPLRWRLLCLSADRHTLLIICHHIAFDGWSLGVFVRDLCALYGPAGSRAAARLEPLPVQYTDFAQWQYERVAAGEFENDLRFWVRQLAGKAAPLEFPTGRPRPARRTFRGRVYGFTIDPPVVRRLRVLAHLANVPPFSVLSAVFAMTLRSCTGRGGTPFATPVANRVRPELEELIGVFINTVCLRVAIEDSDSFRGLVQRANGTCQAALGHAEVPFELVVRAVNPPRDPSRNSLFDAMLVYQNSPVPPLSLPGLSASIEQIDTDTALFDLTLCVEDRQGGFLCSLEFNTEILDRTWAERIADRFRTLLTAGVTDPEVPVVQMLAA